MTKLKIASQLTGIKHIAIAGGVSANSGIRQVLKAAEADLGWTTYIPKFEFTTDNAAMIGVAGVLRWESGIRGSLSDAADPRLPF